MLTSPTFAFHNITYQATMKPYVKLYERVFPHTVGRRGSVALSDLIIKQAKPRDKRYTLSDGRGLILEVHPNGRKY